MSEESPVYQSYLLRLWRADGAGKAAWRASLESAQSGERRAFADLASLFAFLEAQTGASNQEDRAQPTEP